MSTLRTPMPRWMALCWIAALLLLVVVIATPIGLFAEDRRDDFERECAARGGVAVSDYPDGRICIKAEKIDLP